MKNQAIDTISFVPLRQCSVRSLYICILNLSAFSAESQIFNLNTTTHLFKKVTSAFDGFFSVPRLFLAIESPLKIMKNVFFLIFNKFKLKVFVVFHLSFCPDFLLIYKNGLIRKLWLVSKFVKSQAGQQMITIHILPNISRSKGSQAMKFGHLTKYSMRNILLQESCRK